MSLHDFYKKVNVLPGSRLTSRQFGRYIEAILDYYKLSNPKPIHIDLPGNLSDDDKITLRNYIRDGIPDEVIEGLSRRDRLLLRYEISHAILNSTAVAADQGGRRKSRNFRKRKTRRFSRKLK